MYYFFIDPATPEIYPLSRHDALPICRGRRHRRGRLPPPLPQSRQEAQEGRPDRRDHVLELIPDRRPPAPPRSEEHTSELQSRQYLACRLLLEKNNEYTSLLEPPTLLA